MTVEKTCEVCNGLFSVKPYRAETARFCSYRCGGTVHERERLRKQPRDYMLGNTFRANKPPLNAFTSETVRGKAHPRWVEGRERVCERCANAFRQPPWLERQNGPARFCSAECFRKSGIFDGEKSPTWVGGPTTYRGRGWLRARLVVVADQGGRCADCERLIGDGLPVHHIKPFRLFPSAAEANARGNLVGLCQSCHMKRERRAA